MNRSIRLCLLGSILLLLGITYYGMHEPIGMARAFRETPGCPVNSTIRDGSYQEGVNKPEIRNESISEPMHSPVPDAAIASEISFRGMLLPDAVRWLMIEVLRLNRELAQRSDADTLPVPDVLEKTDVLSRIRAGNGISLHMVDGNLEISASTITKGEPVCQSCSTSQNSSTTENGVSEENNNSSTPPDDEDSPAIPDIFVLRDGDTMTGNLSTPELHAGIAEIDNAAILNLTSELITTNSLTSTNIVAQEMTGDILSIGDITSNRIVSNSLNTSTIEVESVTLSTATPSAVLTTDHNGSVVSNNNLQWSSGVSGLGINVDLPEEALDISGNLRIRGSDSAILFTGETSPNIHAAIRIEESVNQLRIEAENKAIHFANGGGNSDTVTLSPQGNLTVHNREFSQIMARYIKDHPGQHNGALSLETYGDHPVGGSHLFLRMSRGSYSSPTGVNSGDRLGSLLFAGYNNGDFQNSAALFAKVDGTVTTGAVPTKLTFETGSNYTTRRERLLISSDGSIVVNPSGYDSDFRIRGDADNQLFITDASEDKVAIGGSSKHGKLSITTENSVGLYIDNTGSANSIEDSSGAKLTSVGIWTDSSDRSRKQSIRNLDYGLDTLMELRPVSYSWKETGAYDIGFIAQEVQEVVPELVFGSEGSYSMSYSHLTALLTRSLQEQHLIVQDLDARFKRQHNQLQDQVDTLESELKDDESLSSFENLVSDIRAIEQQLELLEAGSSGILGISQDEVRDIPPETTPLPDPNDIPDTTPIASDEAVTQLRDQDPVSILELEHTIPPEITTETINTTSLTSDDITAINQITAGPVILGHTETSSTNATISTLSGPLMVQHLASGPVDFMNGRVTISKDGSVHISEGVIIGNDMIRQINIPIEEGSRSYTLEFVMPRSSDMYAIAPSASWITSIAVPEKTPNGFVLRFSEPAPADATIDWIILD